MPTSQWESLRASSDVHYWCQYFREIFSILGFVTVIAHFEYSVSPEHKKVFQTRKHLSLNSERLFKISKRYFLLHRHLNGEFSIIKLPNLIVLGKSRRVYCSGINFTGKKTKELSL